MAVSQQAVPCLAYLTRAREDMNWPAIRSMERQQKSKRAEPPRPDSRIKQTHRHAGSVWHTIGHTKQTKYRIEQVINGCKFVMWTDISASKVQRYLADLRNSENGLSAQTSNYYLQSIKQFCRWMVQDVGSKWSSPQSCSKHYETR